MKDLTHTITVNATPQEAYEAIIDVRSWWGATNIVGATDRLGADWFYLVPDLHYSKQRTEPAPAAAQPARQPAPELVS